MRIDLDRDCDRVYVRAGPVKMSGSVSVRCEVDTVRCAVVGCYAVKGASNHWYIVWADAAGGMFHCVEYTRDMFRTIGDRARVVCGPGCGQKIFEKFLSGKAI